MRHSRTQCLPPPRLCKQGQRRGRENTSARTKTGSHASPSPSLHCVSLPLLPPLVVVARPVIVFATRRGCEKLRLAFRACFSALTFTLPSLILSCLPCSQLATCHLHATQTLGGQRSASPSIAASSWLNMHYEFTARSG